MICAGLDLAKSSDFSALVILDAARRKILAAVRLPHVDYRRQIEQIAPALERADIVAVDGSGVGAAVLEMLPPGLRVAPVVITGGDGIRVNELGAVRASKRALIDLLGRANLTVAENAPGREALLAEMSQFVSKSAGRGRVKLEARRGNDDLVLAAALAVLGATLAMRREP